MDSSDDIMTSERLEPMTATHLADIAGIRHGFFTRKGGVSKGIYASLNCGYGSMDLREDVAANRSRVAANLGVSTSHLITPHQVHGATAIATSQPWSDPSRATAADAIVTATPGLAVGVLTADCAPILLADAEARVVAAAHAGWKGARSGIIAAVIAAMEEIGARRERITAAIGPTISQASYEVGQDFREALLSDAPAAARYFSEMPGQTRPLFDLPGFAKALLRDAGVTRIDDLQCCTYQNESLFYSYRRSVHRGEPDYGRQISAIVIE
jgi:hypothetical protein